MAIKILIAGPPSCGKTVRRELLEKALGIPGFETSKILALDRRNSKIIKSGGLVDDKRVLDSLGFVFGEDEFILSGFPRTLAQAQGLWGEFSSEKKRGMIILNLLRDRDGCQELSRKRDRPDDADFDLRWGLYVENQSPVKNFLSPRIGGRWIDFHMTDSIDDDGQQLLHVVRKRSGHVPRRSLKGLQKRHAHLIA